MTTFLDEDDEDIFSRCYEEGHWEWSEAGKQLIFVHNADYDQKSQSDINLKASKIRQLEFKVEIDLIEEHWFRNHLQKPYRENDVVTLQDVKDIVFFTAPRTILTHEVINIFHLPATDRFLRALIFYCQYYLQISSEMAERCLQLQYKIKTTRSQQIEDTYQENLQDLRLLLSKEYCALLLGSGEYRKYHHMGLGTTQSMTRKDSILFETFLLISIQIVKIALGRKSAEQIELEIQRLFKTNTYNTTKHKLKSVFEDQISKAEYAVLFGGCELRGKSMALRSPLSNEMTCVKHDTDYRLMGIGTIEFPILNTRLLYFINILSSPEKHLGDLGLSLGIIGLSRDRFDTMLREIQRTSRSSSGSMGRRMSSRRSSSVRSSVLRSKFAFEGSKLYEDIILPDKRIESSADLPEVYPGKLIPKRHQKNEQRQKWLRYAAMLKRREEKKRNAYRRRIQCRK